MSAHKFRTLRAKEHPMRTRAKFRFLRTFSRDERGSVIIMLTVYLPVIVGLITLAADMSYVLWSRNMLQATAEAAALAGASQLPNGKAAALAAAKEYAAKNMPASRYGAVLKDADVAYGIWNDGCTSAACFQDSGAQSCETFKCNAVKATTRLAAANGNSLVLAFAPLVGISNFDVTATAVAKRGPRSGAQNKWYATIVEDISWSFSEELPSARAANQALLDCIDAYAVSGSKLGIALFTGVSPSPLYQDQIAVHGTGNYDTLKNKIQNINRCGSSGMPPCSGSNISSGMKSAIDAMCPQASSCPLPESAGAGQALIIVTDGIPNCGSQRNCSNTDLKNRAVEQANRAASEGIDVYTIYYGNSDSDAQWLASLVRGKGKAFKTPTASELKDKMRQACESGLELAHRLVW
jgi:Flp pilus assembly protein TadG